MRWYTLSVIYCYTVFCSIIQAAASSEQGMPPLSGIGYVKGDPLRGGELSIVELQEPNNNITTALHRFNGFAGSGECAAIFEKSNVEPEAVDIHPINSIDGIALSVAGQLASKAICHEHDLANAVIDACQKCNKEAGMLSLLLEHKTAQQVISYIIAVRYADQRLVLLGKKEEDQVYFVPPPTSYTSFMYDMQKDDANRFTLDGHKPKGGTAPVIMWGAPTHSD